MEVFCHHSGWCVALKGQPTRDHFKQNNSKRVDVATLITRVASHLFRGYVEWCPRLSSRKCARGCSQELCKAKIGENGFAHRVMCCVPLVEQNISRFEVAMDHAMLVSIVNGKTDRREKLHNLCRRGENPLSGSAMNVVCQCLSFHILHDHIGQGGFFLGGSDMEVMDLHNVGMVQRGDKLRLALETGDKMGIFLQIGMQQLDRNVALELRIEGFPDLCHTSSSQLFLEFIFTKASWTCTHIALSSSAGAGDCLSVRPRFTRRNPSHY